MTDCNLMCMQQSVNKTHCIRLTGLINVYRLEEGQKKRTNNHSNSTLYLKCLVAFAFDTLIVRINP